MNHERQGTLFWAGLAAYVALCDVFGKETLTSAFARGVENPRTRPFVIGALGVTALHLLDAIPHEPIELDPFFMIGGLYDRSKELFDRLAQGTEPERT